jgi:hypothetical protein
MRRFWHRTGGSTRCVLAAEHDFALTQSPDAVPAFKEIGAEPVIADALDAAAVKVAVGRIRPNAVINELTSLPRHYTPAEAGRDSLAYPFPGELRVGSTLDEGKKVGVDHVGVRRAHAVRELLAAGAASPRP